MMNARTNVECILAAIALLSGCGGSVETSSSVDPGTQPGDLPDAQGGDGGTDTDGATAQPDCGATFCVDCACSCPDGVQKPYGGCFDGCDTVPETILSCTADCSEICGPSMQPCSSGNECAAGYECYSFQQCSTCEPKGFCMPSPCDPDGCYTSGECGAGSFCNGGNPNGAVQGQCLPQPAAGQCWKDSDCPESATCEGASSCPVCQPCNAPTLPGTCKAAPGQETVVLWIDGTVYFDQELIAPIWFNFRSTAAYLPGCATYDIEVLANGGWVNKGPNVMCGWEGVAVKVPAGGAYETHVAQIDIDAWSYPKFRLRGYWYEGCQDGLPISAAQCTAAHEVLSREFVVQYKPL
ncbi:MAG TPA: hypothetical protein PLI95_24025 [Polyangiaceae bacterium]|nr:hypothetical protein [Polyangiaceae bacterium]